MASTCMESAAKHKRGLSTVLKSAACEWLVIGGMLFNAIITYVLTKIASYGTIQPPCIFCSRIDHVLGNKKPGFYRSLLCGRHKSEISSMVACHTHDKIVDGNGMCEECLFSVLAVNETTNMYRTLLSKVGNLSGLFPLKNSYSNSGYMAASVGTRLCSCCKKPWILRKNGHRAHRARHSRPNIPLPLFSSGSGYNRYEKFKDVQHHIRRHGKTERDSLTHIGYSGLRISSDSETELPPSDHDDELLNGDLSSTSEGYITEDELKVNNKVSSELSFKRRPDLSQRSTSVHIDKLRRKKLGVSGYDNDIPVRDLYLNESTGPQDTLLPQLISFDTDATINVSKTRIPSKKEFEDAFRISDCSEISVMSELKALADSSFVYCTDGHAEDSKKQDGNGLIDLRDISATKLMPLNKVSKMIGSGVTDGTDFEKELSSVKPFVFSTKLETNESMADVTGVVEPGKNVDKTVKSLSEEIKQESSHFEKRFGSPEENSIGEVETEHSMTELKRQLDEERKRISVLYAELEEERSASAVAANQAMAMITRLQEEKASLRMEALQYLRMMEELAEYNVDALEKANDLLAEREKEILEMEADLELFQSKFTGSVADSVPETENKLNENIISDEKCIPFTMPSFEDEKLFISKTLKTMEEKLQVLTVQLPSNRDHLEETGYVSHERASPERYLMVNGESDESRHIESIQFSTEEGLCVSRDCFIPLGDQDSDSDGKHHSSTKGFDMISLQNEICDLNERMEAFESDWNFVKRTLDTLKYGNDGLRFIQEIALHLAELRILSLRCKSQSFRVFSEHNQVTTEELNYSLT